MSLLGIDLFNLKPKFGQIGMSFQPQRSGHVEEQVVVRLVPPCLSQCFVRVTVGRITKRPGKGMPCLDVPPQRGERAFRLQGISLQGLRNRARAPATPSVRRSKRWGAEASRRARPRRAVLMRSPVLA